MLQWNVLATQMDIRPEGKSQNVLSDIRLGSYLMHYYAGILTSHTKNHLEIKLSHISNQITK